MSPASAAEGRELDLSVELGMRCEPLLIGLGARADIGVVRTGRRQRRVVFALVLDERGNNFGVPTRLRPDLHDLHLRPQPEKEQGFLRDGERRHARGRTLGDARQQESGRATRRSVSWVLLRGCAGGSHQRDSESSQCALMQCGHSASERAAALARTLRTFLRFIDSQRTAVHLVAVQGLNCRLRFVLFHVDKAKAAGLAGFTVHNQV